MRQLTKRHPITAFFTATYLFSWLIWVPLAVASQWADYHPSGGLLALAALGAFGPSLVGLFMAWLSGGRAGLRAIWSRLKGWRVGSRWYLFTFLLIPAILLGAWAMRTLAGEAVLPFGASNLYTRAPGMPLWLVPIVGFFPFLLGGSLNEEFGWRGFALPQLLKRFSPLTASILLGLAWGIWHVPLLFIPGASTIGTAFPAFMLMVVPLTTLFTYIHLQTGGSLLFAVLFHNMVNLSSEAMPLSITDWAAVGITWGVTALVVGSRWSLWTERPGTGESVTPAA